MVDGVGCTGKLLVITLNFSLFTNVKEKVLFLFKVCHKLKIDFLLSTQISMSVQ